MISKGEHFVTCGQMKVLEHRADENGLSYYKMMENAGTGAASVIMESEAYWSAAREDTAKAAAETPKAAEDFAYDIGDLSKSDKKHEAYIAGAYLKQRVYIFCGKGNNGGDGFVVARIMHDRGYDITVILVDGKPKTEDAETNFKLLEKRNIRVLDMCENKRALMELDGAPDVIVDAIYGTGFKGKLHGNGLKAAIYINRYARGEYGIPSIANVMVAALDIPSGIGGDMVEEKHLDPNSISAHLTLTFHAKKPVHLQKFAAKYCGEIFVIDIGIDEEKLWNIWDR